MQEIAIACFICRVRKTNWGQSPLFPVTSAGTEKLRPLALKADVASAVVPFVKFVASDAPDARRGVIVKDAPIKVAGENFGAEVDDVAVKFVYADGTEVAGTVSAASDSLVSVVWPAALDGVADGIELTLTITRTVEGEDYTSPESKAVVG